MQDNNQAENIELVLPDEEQETTEEAVVEEEVQTTELEHKNELDEVSESVKKRIDKLTYKMREAERQRDEALNYAKSINSNNTELKEKLKNSDTSLFKEYDSRVQSDIERAKIHLKEAQDAGDAEAIADATEKLSRASAEAENLKRLQAQQAIRDKKAEQVVEQDPVQLKTDTPPAPDPKAEAWASKNSWFGQDTVMTFAAFGIHRQLVEEEGYDPTSEDYYKEVDNRMKANFPTKFSQEQQTPVQQVAASTPGVAGKKGARKVKLTPSQVAIAKRLGVPLKEYAKHIEGV